MKVAHHRHLRAAFGSRMVIYDHPSSMSFEERLVKSRVRLLKKSPFFGTLLLNAQHKITEDVPTAATDGQTLLLNRKFMEAHGLKTY